MMYNRLWINCLLRRKSMRGSCKIMSFFITPLSIPLLMGTLFPIILYCMNTRLGLMQYQDFVLNIIIHLKSNLKVLNWDIKQEQGSINLDLDMDLDLKFSMDLDMDLDLKIVGFGYGLGSIFLNGFGHGLGFENRWIWIWTWIDIFKWIWIWTWIWK